jgi:hypothetical protein
VSVSDLSYGIWAVCAAGVLGLWATSYGSSTAVARPAAALSSLATHVVFRLSLALGYMWLGWHLFAR